jgi:hypothetical protein
MRQNTVDMNQSKDNGNMGMSEFSKVSKGNVESLDLRTVFIENYGVSMEMPVYYH